MKANLIGTITPTGPVAIDAIKGYLAIGCGGLFGIGTGYRLYKLDDLTRFMDLPMRPVTAEQLTFSQDGNLVAAAERSSEYYIQGWVYDVTTGKYQAILRGGPTKGQARFGSDGVALSPNGKFLILSSQDDRAVINDLPSGDWLYMGNNTLERKFFAWSHDGRFLASVLDRQNVNRTVEMWVFPKGEDSQISDCTFSWKAVVEDWGTGDLGSDGSIGLDFSPDSRWLGAGGGSKKKGVVQIFDVKANTLLCQSQTQPSEVRVLKFTPGGEFLVSGDRNGILTLWKLQLEGTPELKVIETAKFDGTILALGLAQPKDGLIVACKRGGAVVVSHVSLPDEVY